MYLSGNPEKLVEDAEKYGPNTYAGIQERRLDSDAAS